MDVHVREDLYVLDYEGNIKDTIFTSEDKRTPGYANNINIKESNTGYSDLTFSMPNTILSDDGAKIKNPKLSLLAPLVRLRYRRTVYYTGAKAISVKEPVGYGDKVQYVEKTYYPDYPRNIIEDHIMDYIVQPTNRNRTNLKIDTDFTAMDYPRFCLSKKRVGMSLDSSIVTKPEWSLYQNEPLDVAGTVKYIKWTSALNHAYNPNRSAVDGIEEVSDQCYWNPYIAKEYPLNKDVIEDIIEHISSISEYGLLATVIYIPIRVKDDNRNMDSCRFKGKLYKTESFICLNIYDLRSLSSAGLDPELHTSDYGWEWSQLDKVEPYLGPNNALNYLRYILDGTGWSVATRINSTTHQEEPDVDIEKVKISNPKGSTSEYDTVDKTIALSVSNSNAYNSITEECKGFQLYPIFDCINKTVALNIFAGKNYGLTYRLGTNLLDDDNKLDGEKVITKLYVSGGKNYNGSDNINIGTAERTYTKYLNGFYKNTSQLPTSSVEGVWAIVDPQLNTQKPWITDATHTNRKVYRFDTPSNRWVEASKNSEGNYYVEINGEIKVIDIVSGIALDNNGEWNPNDQSYIIGRSPYGSNYILNFKWAYQNKWITKEQILDIYNYEKQIHDKNIVFIDKYTEAKIQLENNYRDAVNQYEIDENGYQSIFQSLQNKYHFDVSQQSKGSFYAFPTLPGQPTNAKLASHDFYKVGTKVYWNVLKHYDSQGNPKDGLYVPVYSDYTDQITPSDEESQWKPYIKGYMQRMVESVDRYDGDNLTTPERYYNYIRLKKKIDFTNDSSKAAKGFKYVADDGKEDTENPTIIRASAGYIETWNKYVGGGTGSGAGEIAKYYNKSLDDLQKVNECLNSLNDLQSKYNIWFDSCKAIRAEEYSLYGDFFIEGTYTNTDQPYVGVLFDEGMEASDKFSVPEVTYVVSVIDSSGLFEYREPQVTKYICNQCNYTKFTEFTHCPVCGSNDIETQRDTYNDLVNQLFSVGQIVPKAGDYVSIYDEQMGLYGILGLITEISRHPDNPSTNSITINTAYSDSEDLVGDVITASNTVLNNTDIYARTAVLNADGTLDTNSIQKTLNTTNANVSIVGTSGSTLLDSTGLRTIEGIGEDAKGMRYTGSGIYITDNFSSTDATTWYKVLDNNGIEADMIVGTLNAKNVIVQSAKGEKLILDENGIILKHDEASPYHFTPFETEQAKSSAKYCKKWANNNNIDTYIGTQANGDNLAFFNGFLVAKEGSNIANWVTSNEGFYHLNGQNQKDLWLSPTGISGTVLNTTQKYAYYSNGNFGVTPNGNLLANGANISGKVVITDSGSEFNDGTVGGFDVDSNGLKKNDTIILSSSGYNGTVSIKDGVSSNGPWAIYSKGNFGVTTGGVLWAKGGKFGGQIESESGHIGGWTIGTYRLSATGTQTDYGSFGMALDVNPSVKSAIWIGTDLDTNNAVFRVRKDGKLFATNAEITGKVTAATGKIAGFTISGNNLMGTQAGLCGLDGDGWAFWAGPYTATGVPGTDAPFRVGHGGNMVCTNANIKGTITATTLTANSSGSIAGWSIDTDNGFTSDYAAIRPNGEAYFYPQTSGGGEYYFKNNLYLHSTSKQEMVSGTSILLATTSAPAAAETGQVYLYGTKSGDGSSKSGSGVFLYTPNGSIRLNANTNVYIDSAGCKIDSSLIKIGTDSGSGKINIGDSADTVYIKGQAYLGGSSRGIKENIRQLDLNEIEDLYNKVKAMPFYSYNYKKEYGDDKELHRGFIIEDIEKSIIGDYLFIKQDEKDKKVKTFNPIGLSKMNLILIQQLQKKIDQLQNEVNQLKKEKTN